MKKIRMQIKLKQNTAGTCLALLFVSGMVAASEILNNHEIIFPEILALLSGAWIAGRQPWNVSKIRMVTVMTISALGGILIVRYLPFPLYGQLMSALSLSAVMLMLSRTSMVPLISACVLPVMLGTDTVIYPISVGIMVGIIAAVQGIMEWGRLRTPKPFIPKVPEPMDYILWGKRLILLAAIIGGAVAGGQLYLTVPPLIVAFTELSEPDCRLHTRRRGLFVLMGISAVAGTAGRLLLTEYLNLPLTAAVFGAAFLLLCCMNRLNLYFPPAGALLLLPFILPAEGLVWYPLKTMIGFSILYGAALVANREWNILKNTEEPEETGGNA